MIQTQGTDPIHINWLESVYYTADEKKTHLFCIESMAESCISVCYLQTQFAQDAVHSASSHTAVFSVFLEMENSSGTWKSIWKNPCKAKEFHL